MDGEVADPNCCPCCWRRFRAAERAADEARYKRPVTRPEIIKMIYATVVAGREWQGNWMQADYCPALVPRNFSSPLPKSAVVERYVFNRTVARFSTHISTRIVCEGITVFEEIEVCRI